MNTRQVQQHCMVKGFIIPALFIGSLVPLTQLSAATVTEIHAGEPNATNLVIYNQNTGLVQRSYALPPLKPLQEVIVSDVINNIDTSSLKLTLPARILEQSVIGAERADGIEQLLEASINDVIELTLNTASQAANASIKAELLGFDHSYLFLKNRHQGTQAISRGHIASIQFPKELTATKGAQIAFVTSGTNTDSQLDVSYQTPGLNWKMDYRLEIGSNPKIARLTGFANVFNNTQTTFKDANTQLVAGQIQQVRPTMAVRQLKSAPVAMMADAMVESSPAPQKLDAFYRYDLPRALSIRPNQNKQIAFLSSEQVSIKRDYQLTFYVGDNADSNTHTHKPTVRLQFANSERNQLGTPLPAGAIRVFQQTSTNDNNPSSALIGSQNIGHIAKNSAVKLNLGQSFDLSVKRHQHRYNQASNNTTVGQTLEISNASDTPATLVLSANFHREFNLTSTSIQPTPTGGNRLEWQLSIPANGKKTLQFVARLQKR